jgi:hypothetical protein
MGTINPKKPATKGANMSGSNGSKQIDIVRDPMPQGMYFQYAEEKTAEEFFGMRVVPGDGNGPVRLVPNDGGENSTPLAVVYFDGPDDFAWSMKRLGKFRLLSRAVKVRRKKLEGALKLSRGLSSSGRHAMFIDNMTSYFLPKDGIDDQRRDVFLWAYNRLKTRIIPVRNEQTAALDGLIPNQTQFGPMLYAALRHLPIRLEGELMLPLAYAASFQPPEKAEDGVGGVSYLSDTMLFDGKAYRFYVLKTYNPEADDQFTMGELFRLPVDLLWSSDVTFQQGIYHWWGSLVARAQSSVVRYEEPVSVPKGLLGKLFGWLYRRKKRIRLDFPDFPAIEEQLDGLVRKTTVVGESIDKVRKAFTPGNSQSLELGYGWHIQTNPDLLLDEHANHMAELGDPEATMVVGKKVRTDKAFGLKANKFWSWLLSGETGSGKTTLKYALAKQISPYGVEFLLTQGIDEGGPVFVMEEDGHTIFIDARPDGKVEIPEWARPFGDHFHIYNKADPATKEDLIRLIAEDEREADEIAERFAAEVEAHGPEGTLPICVQVGAKDFRAYRFALSLKRSLDLKVQQPLYVRTRIRQWRSYDGLGSIVKPDWHERFHEIPKAIGDAWRSDIGLDIRDCRKYGVNVFGTSLTASELQGGESQFEAGFFDLWTVHIDLNLDNRVVTVTSPKHDKTLGKNIDVSLPKNVTDYIGQRLPAFKRR